jgi:CHASE2 domain
LIEGLNRAQVEGVVDKDLPDLSGRILLVGQVATALTDNGPTPFSGFTPLVLVHANVIENILREDYGRRVPAGWMWLGGHDSRDNWTGDPVHPEFRCSGSLLSRVSRPLRDRFDVCLDPT